MQGNVVGVDSAILSPTTGSAGLGFAIPSRSAQFVIDRLRTYGWVRPAWIGVKLQQVTPEIADAIGMTTVNGSIVSWVRAEGPAGKAGLAVGDVILRFNNTVPTDERALLRDIAQTSVGDTITLLARHDGTEHSLAITVAAWPRNQWDALDAPVPTQRPKISIPPDLGLSLSPVAKEDRTKLGLEADITGVMITRVAANSDPAHRGIVSGDVILRVQDKPVAAPADVMAGLSAARASKREFVLLLVWPKVRDVPGPKWVPLELGAPGG
jgi:serine protease Do